MTYVVDAIDVKLQRSLSMVKAPFDRMIIELHDLYSMRGGRMLTEFTQLILHDKNTIDTDVFRMMSRTPMRLIFVACCDRIK